MWLTIYYFFSYVIFFYTLAAMILLLFLAVRSNIAQKRLMINMPDDDSIRYILRSSPITPSVAIVAPAYNEEKVILDFMRSALNINYPNYEIIVVNDDSSDDTLNVLIENYELVAIPFINHQRVPSKPIKRVFKSTNPNFSKITVIDKERGGTKADASNAALNIINSKYFVCTDCDCILEPMSVYRMMWHIINSHDPIIGVGATMLMLNACKVKDGEVSEASVSWNPPVTFQTIEYMRSFMIGKMGWSSMNTLPNISGGFGLFATDIVVKSGGYDPASFAEDVDMMLRMVTYMENTGQKYRFAQISHLCCWTEGPSSPFTLYRQRKRWARGLCEVISNHRKLFFNPKYGPTGAFTLPYIYLFEFLAPILEVGGFLFMIWLIFIGAVNWNTFFVIFGMIYIFSVSLTFLVLIHDYAIKAVKWKNTFMSYLKLILAGILEPFLYHPFVTTCSIIGYINFVTNKRAQWTHIKRRGAAKSTVSDREQEDIANPSLQS